MKLKEFFSGEINNKRYNAAYNTVDLFWENEVLANRMMVVVFLLASLADAVSLVLTQLGVFELTGHAAVISLLFPMIENLIAAVVCVYFKGETKWMKYFLSIAIVLICAQMDFFLTYNVVIIMALPVVTSTRYYDHKFTAMIGAFSAVLFGLSAYLSCKLKFTYVDVNYIGYAPGTKLTYIDSMQQMINDAGYNIHYYTLYYMFQNYQSKLIIFILIAAFCYIIAKRGRYMVDKEAEIITKTARIDQELALARDIQANMLPTDWPLYPDEKSFKCFATMTPAKEVGGDFYDAFMIDDNHLAIVMADVSGKGVPASLFMVKGKTLIKENTIPGCDLGEVFSKVNDKLCEDNKDGLFITAFEGVLDLRNGEFNFVNAGHETPFIAKKAKAFEPYATKAAFVLGGMEGMKYKAGVMQLEPGDKLFQYTDGVTEATNIDKELYGMERLGEILKKNSQLNPTDLLPAVKEDIDAFVGKAEQFDDLTMLCLEFVSFK